MAAGGSWTSRNPPASADKAAEIVGITYRQLDYWARTDLDPPVARRRQRQRQPPQVRLPRPARAADHQAAPRRRHQARDGARRVRRAAATIVGDDIASANLVIDGARSRCARRRRAARPAPAGPGRAQRHEPRPVQGRARRPDRGRLRPGAERSPPLATSAEPPHRVTGLRCSALAARRRPTAPSGAKLTEFGGWDMPLSYPTGTLAEHPACRSGAVVFDVSHLGTVRVDGPDAFDRLQAALTNDLGTDRARAGPVHPPARPRRRLGARRHHRVVGRRRALRRHAQRLEHRPGARRPRGRGGRRRHRRPGDPRRPGPGGPRAAGHGVARGRRRRPVPRSPACAWDGVRRASSPAPATPARTASRSPCPPSRRRPPLGRGRSAPASSPPGSAPATRCASRPASRCTATSSARHHAAAGRARLGGALGQGRLPRPRRPRRREGARASPAGCGASPPRAAARPGRASPVLIDGDAGGRGHQRQLLPHPRPRHRPGLPAARRRADGAAVAIEVRAGQTLPGQVVKPPFVTLT